MQLIIEIISLNVYELINSYIIHIFCMINKLLIWFKINITDNCFILLGERSLSSVSSSTCFWILFHDSTALTVIEYYP